MSSITFPEIGSIRRQPDGSYHVGPIDYLGGPFKTATEFFKAWAARKPSRTLNTKGIISACGGPGPVAEECLQSMREFLDQLAKLLAKGPLDAEFDTGPFPLRHTDLGIHNILFDDEWNILSVIDWEFAIAAPWEMVCQSMVLSHESRTIWPIFYTETGAPRDEDVQESLDDQAYFLARIKHWEKELGVVDALSKVMSSEKMRDLAEAFKNFEEFRYGRPGFYLRMLRAHFGDRMEDF